MTVRTPQLLGFVLLSISLSATAGDSLCTSKEHVYFSCAFANGKRASLCGDAFVAEKGGEWIEPAHPWLQYRFGTPGKIELVYPSIRDDSLSMFYGENFRAQGGAVGTDRVMFINKGIAYAIEYWFPYESDAYYAVEAGDPKQLEVPFAGERKTSYPKIKLRCVGNVDHERFFDLSRFLVNRREQER